MGTRPDNTECCNQKKSSVGIVDSMGRSETRPLHTLQAGQRGTSPTGGTVVTGIRTLCVWEGPGGSILHPYPGDFVSGVILLQCQVPGWNSIVTDSTRRMVPLQ